MGTKTSSTFSGLLGQKVLLLLAVVAVIHAVDLEVKLDPMPSGTPPTSALDSVTKKIPTLKITCDASGLGSTRPNTISLTIKGTDGSSAQHPRCVRIENKCAYEWLNVMCTDDAKVFECKTTGPDKTSAPHTLKLSVQDGQVTVIPATAQNMLRTVGDTIPLTCKATLKSKDPPEDDKVVWKWELKDDEENAVWAAIDLVTLKTAKTHPLVKSACMGAEATATLTLQLKPDDHKRVYRCTYKNSMFDTDAPFREIKAGQFGVGMVRERVNRNQKQEKRKINYSSSSLTGMILGIFSFVLVAFMGVCYSYRKHRTGKKYDIVKSLLQQEEEELDKIETSLGVAAAQRGVSSSRGDPSGMEESSVAESSVVESSVAESSVAESSVAESSVVEN